MEYSLGQVYNYFKTVFKVERSSSNWFIFDNPFDLDGAGKKKMSVHFRYRVVKCWRTGYKDSIINFLKSYENMSYPDVVRLLKDQNESSFKEIPEDNLKHTLYSYSSISMPKNFVSLDNIAYNEGLEVCDYLVRRGMDVSLLASKGFGYVPDCSSLFYGYLLIPFKVKGVLCYYIGRTFKEYERRYYNPSKLCCGIGKGDILYNQDALSLEDEVFLTEGWSDAYFFGNQGVAYMGASLSDTHKTILLDSSVKKIVFVPDIGTIRGKTYFQNACISALDLVHCKKIKVIDLSLFKSYGKDVNEIFLNGAFSMLKDYISKQPYDDYKGLLFKSMR